MDTIVLFVGRHMGRTVPLGYMEAPAWKDRIPIAEINAVLEELQRLQPNGEFDWIPVPHIKHRILVSKQLQEATAHVDR